MPKPMEWTRLEPLTRADGLDEGLRAEVHDPLWLLARQWQLGELWGSDAGTPVQAVLRMDCTPMTRYVGGQVSAALAGDVAGTRLTGVEPLEVLIENERVHVPSSARVDLALEAGLHLLRLLDPAGDRGYRTDLADTFRPATPPGGADATGDAGRLTGLLSGRVPDGTLLAWAGKVDGGAIALAALDQPFRDRVEGAVAGWKDWLAGLGAAERGRVETAFGDWLRWYDGLLAEPGASGTTGSAWVPDRMEYEAAVSVPGRNGETVLTVPEHHGEHLDWYSFATVGGSLGATRADLVDWPWTDEDGETVSRTVIPSPVAFPGMPASRYWEFEDARVDFGSVAAGAQQLAHLLLVEFALVYGDDWFLIPVDMPVGTLSRVNWLVVTDSFGIRTLVPSARSVDGADRTGQLDWDMFALSPDPRPVASGTARAPDGLLLPPSLGTSLPGRAVEEVLLLRDEAANMAWAVERVVESATGRPHDRAEAWHRSREASPPVTPGSAFRYRLSTDPPDHWLPLFPTRIEGDAPAVHFLRGGAPTGRILEPDRTPGTDPLYLHEEEVPREAVALTRSFQHARWIDGRTYVWMARRKAVARPQGGSAIGFDVLEPQS